MYRALVVIVLAFALVDTAAACKPAECHKVWKNGQLVKECFCPPGKVMAMIENVFRCFDKTPQCPNGFYHEGKCHCFPGTTRDYTGACGKICPNCENGWCSSPFKCECNDGFTMSYGQCYPNNYYPSHWYPQYPQYPQNPQYPQIPPNPPQLQPRQHP